MAPIIRWLIEKQIVFHPTKENEDDCRGLIYIISRMEWYCRLPGMLNGFAKDDRVPAELKQRIISLYTAILSYLMTIVCSHLHNLSFRKPSDISHWQSRRVGLTIVKDAESVLPVFNEDCVQKPLKALVAAISVESRRSAAAVEQPKLSRETTQVLNHLNVLDPRPSIWSVEIDSSHPTNQLYRALFSTQEYELF